MKNIVIAGGGSGGHIFPALAIADGLCAHGIDAKQITFIGSRGALEKDHVPAAGYKLIALAGRGLNRRDYLRNIFRAGILIASCFRVMISFLRRRPSVVIGVGGFVCVPVMISARLLRINCIVHEQNAYVGRTNALAVRLGARMMTTFSETEGAPSNAEHVGMPLNDSFKAALSARDHYRTHPPDQFRVTISGGSLGSLAINEATIAMVKKYHDEMTFSLTHICGAQHFDDVSQKYRKLGYSDDVIVHSFRDDITTLFATSECVVGRGGAGTCAQLSALGVKCVIIPLPSAPGDHQRLNARSLVEESLGVILDQKDLNADTLYEAICARLASPATITPKEKGNASDVIANYLIATYSLTKA